MKNIDRETIEYKPNIDIHTSVYTIIKKQVEYKKDGIDMGRDVKYQPSQSMIEWGAYNGITVVDAYLEAKESTQRLEKLIEELKEVDNRQVGVEPIKEREVSGFIYLAESLRDEFYEIEKLVEDMYEIDLINGSPDVIKEDMKLEMDSVREKEKEELSFYENRHFSPIELAVIDKFIHDSKSEIRSVEDYVKKHIEDKVVAGSSLVNYDEINDSVSIAYALLNMVQSISAGADRVISADEISMSNFIVDDEVGALEFALDSIPRTEIKEMLKMNDGRVRKDIEVMKSNMRRYNEKPMRDSLREHFKKIALMRARYRDVSEVIPNDSIASLNLMSITNKAMEDLDGVFENTIVDVLASTKTYLAQITSVTDLLVEQKEYNLMYRFLDKIDNDFDFAYREQEEADFMSRHNIKSMR